MLISNGFSSLARDWQIWQKVAQKFSDYARLHKRHQATDQEWQQIVLDRLRHVVVEREILVGDRNAPERRYLVQIHGNGIMYMGGNVDRKRAEFIHMFTDLPGVMCYNDPVVKYGDNAFIMIPFHLSVSGKSDIMKVVDISTYDPFVLILTETGEVVELVFKPNWDTKWDEFSRPRRVPFPDGVTIEKIYAMDYAFMALEHGYCYCWSVIDNPLGTRENIRTPPIRLEALSSMYVYYVEPIGELTRLYYVPRSVADGESVLRFKSPFKDDIVDPTAQFVDIQNTDVMALIAQSVFSEEEIVEIAERIRIAEEM